MANVADISAIIKERIKNYDLEVKAATEGRVLSIADGIASVSGLEKTKLGELLVFSKNTFGMALNLEEDFIGVIIFGGYAHINEGDKVKKTGKIMEVPVGNELIGRIVNPLGEAVDGKSPIKTTKMRQTERIAPGIMTRQSVFEPLETGILSIDSMIPIGKGQRELIIGDRKTGKTAIAIDTILNQKGKNVKCVYVSIGQKNSSLANTVRKLAQGQAMKYTTIVSSNASDSDAMQYLAPYSAMAIAEEWMEQGEDVLIIFDDLSKHAVAYRSLSLLLRRPPGREAYPGDVFYLHSKLLERSAKLNKKYGNGSITALPIIETQAGDISAYIPTNVISITDGQIFLMSDAFNSGQRPAVDAGLSVSRVGSAAQSKLMKTVSSSLKLQLANYKEIKSFAEFSSDLDASTKAILDNGQKILELLKQPQFSPYPQEVQAIILFMINNKIIEKFSVEDTVAFKTALLMEIKTNPDFKNICKIFATKKVLEDVTAESLEKLLIRFIKKFNM
ncbi:MAG: F0F1 ATP synthase subunit alpha [Mycoplasmataceae bacterium]|nr:F0F1 ATP synthase subunit alpha [Mycoplasmataceae bacterium]